MKTIYLLTILLGYLRKYDADLLVAFTRTINIHCDSKTYMMGLDAACRELKLALADEPVRDVFEIYTLLVDILDSIKSQMKQSQFPRHIMI